MTDERQDAVKKETLWDYAQSKIALATHRADFSNHADKLTRLAKILAEQPDMINSDPAWACQISELQGYLQKLPAIAKEFREEITRTNEKRRLLSEMSVDLPKEFDA